MTTAVSKFTFDYTNRLVDVLAFDGATPFGEVMLEQTLCQPDQGGKITAGIQKLAQRFLLELLTEKGSMAYHADRGTWFMRDAKMGYLRTQLDVHGSFARALEDVADNLIKDEVDTDPDDERFGDAEITSIAVSPGLAKIYMTLWSRAGRDRAVTIPLTISL